MSPFLDDKHLTAKPQTQTRSPQLSGKRRHSPVGPLGPIAPIAPVGPTGGPPRVALQVATLAFSWSLSWVAVPKSLAGSGESYPQFPVVTDRITSFKAGNEKVSKGLEHSGEAYSGELSVIAASAAKGLGRQAIRIVPFRWPLAHTAITSPFGERWGEFHAGVDLQASSGSLVTASASGKVVHASWSKLGYGNVVVVDHDQGWLTLYAHNSQILVPLGKMVVGGEPIALSGSSGKSTGPHLHFEIRLAGQARDPVALLPRIMAAAALGH